MHQYKWIAILTIFFIILTEKISLLNVGAGLLVAILIAALNKSQLLDFKSFRLKNTHLWLWFLGVLIKEVIVSNFQVAKIVLSRRMDINPHIVDYTSRLSDNFLLTVYANAITLTPGTMTVDICDARFKVHCLNDQYAQGLEGSQLETILLKIEGGIHE